VGKQSDSLAALDPEHRESLMKGQGPELSLTFGKPDPRYELLAQFLNESQSSKLRIFGGGSLGRLRDLLLKRPFTRFV